MRKAFVSSTLLLLGLGAFVAMEASAYGPKMYGPGMHGRGMQGYGMQGGMYGRGRAHGGEGWGGGDYGYHRLAALNLTQEQRDRIAGVRDTQARAMVQSRADLQLARLDLQKLLRSDTPDQNAIDAQIDRMAAIRAGMMKERVGARLQVRSILTPEQRSKLHEGRWRAGGGDDPTPSGDPRRP
jgi:Spy/CpxP family protein refolding chaperone